MFLIAFRPAELAIKNERNREQYDRQKGQPEGEGMNDER
jgi:hypothetical protein